MLALFERDPTSARGRWRARELAAREDDGDGDDGAVELRFVHVRDGIFGVGSGLVENVCCAAVRHELAVHREVDVADGAVGAEDFAEVTVGDVFGEFFDDDLGEGEVLAQYIVVDG